MRVWTKLVSFTYTFPQIEYRDSYNGYYNVLMNDLKSSTRMYVLQFTVINCNG